MTPARRLALRTIRRVGRGPAGTDPRQPGGRRRLHHGEQARRVQLDLARSPTSSAGSRASGPAHQIPVFAALVGAESLVVNQGIKRLFRRTRPTEAGDDRFPVRRPTTSSFPSGHASSAAFAATVLTGWDGKRLAPLWWTMAEHRRRLAGLRSHPPRLRRRGRARHRSRPRPRRPPPAERRSTSPDAAATTWQAGRMPDDEPAASKVAVADRQMSDAEALMWRVEKDPFLGVDVRQRDDPRSGARLRPPPRPHGVRRPRSAPARLARPAQPQRARRPDLGRRSRLRHRPPRAPRRPARSRHSTSAARPRQPVRPRSARPDPPAVAVPRRRGTRRRQGGAACRRCTTRSPTGSTVCACRCSTSTSPATPPCRPEDGSRPTSRRPSPPTSTVDTLLGFVHATFRLPISIARQVGELLADPSSIPTAGSAAVDGHPWRADAAVGDGRGTLTAVDGTFDAAPRRDGASPLPVDPRRRQAPGRLPEHGVPHRLRRGGPPLPRRQGCAGRRAAGHDGGQHTDQGLRRQRLRPRQAARADRRDGHRRALRAHRRRRFGGSQVRRARRRWTRLPSSRRRCRRRC